MPDITVEHDTSYISDMLLKISKANIISDFCVEYFDANRSRMSQITSRKSLEAFLESDGMFDKFIARIKNEGISYSQLELDRSRKYLTTVLRYQIASYVLDVNAASVILLDDDPYMDKAKEVLGK